MSAAEIKELRSLGNISKALLLAVEEFKADRDNKAARFNLAWVYLDILKERCSVDGFKVFSLALERFKDLGFPQKETILYDTICWRVAKMAFTLSHSKENFLKAHELYLAIKELPLPKPSKSYSFLFIAMHKCFKDTTSYLEFSEWWGFNHFMPEHHEKRRLQTGEQIMSIAEQAYLNYFKRLIHPLPLDNQFEIDKAKIRAFKTKLIRLAKEHPEHESIQYLISKSYLALGDKGRALKTILPTASHNRSNLWFWKLLAECNEGDPRLSFSFLCRALSLTSTETQKRNVRLMLTEKLLQRRMYNEARTEIDHLTKNSITGKNTSSKGVKEMKSQEWYLNATNLGSNEELYKKHFFDADEYLDGTKGLYTIVVEFINKHRKMLHFIAPGDVSGFLKYDRLIPNVAIGDVLDIRFKGEIKNGLNQAISIAQTSKKKTGMPFFRTVKGILKNPSSKSSGRIGDVHVHLKLIRVSRLCDGMKVEGKAIRCFDKPNGQFGWKALTLKPVDSKQLPRN